MDVAESARILLIDDHSLFREAIARLLASQRGFMIAGQCATVEEGIRILKETPVDIVLLDINLGMQQGGAFPNLARAGGFAGKILVVTSGVSKLEAARLLQRGCAGIVLKHEPPQLLIESIRGVVSGRSDGDLASTKAALEQLKTAGQAPPALLTRRERQVLRGVFGGRTNKEIAYELGVSEPLVKSVIQQLFTKTSVRTRAQLVRVAVEQYWQELEEQSEPT
jgi:two-component system, NarL family, nitrate/nitrite response regulator NarL